jgi:hypothetical protein
MKPSAKLIEPEHISDEVKDAQYLYGNVVRDYRPKCFAQNTHNVKQALEARCLRATQAVDQPTMDGAITWIKRNFRHLVGKRKKITSASFDTYISNSNASPSVKKILIETYKQLEIDGIDEDSVLSKEQLHKFTTRKSFVKADENVLYRSPFLSKNKACRLIQGATPEFICLVGPWIMSLQTYFKKKWGINNYITFTSGVTTDQAGNCITEGFEAWLILEDDIGTFDASICVDLCELEVWIANYYRAPKAVRDLMTRNIYTHGGAYGGFKYKVDGTRKSGDPFTSLFNSILNALLHVFIFCRVRQCTVLFAKLHIKMLVQGDDNLLRHTGLRIDFVHWMALLGFESEALYRASLHEAEFCSSRLYSTDIGWVFGPKPGRVLAKFGLFINPPKYLAPNVLLRGAALGLYQQCSFIPPIRAYLDKVLKDTEHIKMPDYNSLKPHLKHYLQNVVGEQPWRMVPTKAKETDQVMYSLYEQYGWDNSMQIKFEQELPNIKLGTVVNSPLWQLLVDRDTSGQSALVA